MTPALDLNIRRRDSEVVEEPELVRPLQKRGWTPVRGRGAAVFDESDEEEEQDRGRSKSRVRSQSRATRSRSRSRAGRERERGRAVRVGR